MFNKKGFTLIELLIVIGILAVLATTVLLVINPAQMVKQSRDANRITEINQINKAMLLFQSFGGSSTNMGTHGKVYISIPDPTLAAGQTSDCGYSTGNPLDLPTLGGEYEYQCSNPIDYRNIDGTGWIPVDLTSVQSSAGTLFSSLPIDPINSTEIDDFYYTYIVGSWALSATLESDKYLTTTAINDGGESDTRFEMGNNLAINSFIDVGGEDEGGGEGEEFICGMSNITDIDGNSYSTIQIGTQCWMAENLDYDNGCSSAVWANYTDVGWCGYYTGGPFANEGLLYQWSAAMNGYTTPGAQGLCPTGWHIPTDAEWKTLVEYAAGTPGCESSYGWQCSPAGSHLSSYTLNGDNSTVFSGLLVGFRSSNSVFVDRTSFAFFWSSVDSEGTGTAWTRGLSSSYATVEYNLDGKASGYSVRCLKD